MSAMNHCVYWLKSCKGTTWHKPHKNGGYWKCSSIQPFMPNDARVTWCPHTPHNRGQLLHATNMQLWQIGITPIRWRQPTWRASTVHISVGKNPQVEGHTNEDGDWGPWNKRSKAPRSSPHSPMSSTATDPNGLEQSVHVLRSKGDLNTMNHSPSKFIIEQWLNEDNIMMHLRLHSDVLRSVNVRSRLMTQCIDATNWTKGTRVHVLFSSKQDISSSMLSAQLTTAHLVSLQPLLVPPMTLTKIHPLKVERPFVKCVGEPPL